jgi:hypothetical protein
MNNVMKYVITGHRSGIGKSIFDYYAKQPNIYCTGYDISHHLDLNDSKVHSDFIDSCKDASVIVLNAHTGQQHISLNTLFNFYKSESKHVIVIGSLVSKVWKTIEEVPETFKTYWSQKKLLEDSITSLYDVKIPLKISILRLDWVDTQLSKEYSGKKLTIESVLKAVRYIIENKDSYITSMDLQCTN